MAVKISKRTFRRHEEVVKAFESGIRTKDPSLGNRDIVLVYNGSGSAVGRFGILGISDVLVDPSSSLPEFLRKRAFSGDTPSVSSHDQGRFVITLEPIASGAIGKAVTSGVIPVMVNVTDESHTYAEVGTSLTSLTSGESGSCVILWKESGTGLKYTIVRFGGSGSGSVVWGEVIVGVQYADPGGTPPEGIGTYTVRLTSDTTDVWSSIIYYVADNYVIGSDNRQYKATALSPNINNNPTTSPTYWELQDEINPLPIGQEAVSPSSIDMRDFMPFFQVGAVVPLLVRDGDYYFATQMTRTAVDQGQRSIVWNEDENRMMGAFV